MVEEHRKQRWDLDQADDDNPDFVTCSVVSCPGYGIKHGYLKGDGTYDERVIYSHATKTVNQAPSDALHRLNQAEERIRELGGRTAKDGKLASILGCLRDTLTYG